MSTTIDLPNDVRSSIERYLALYGPPTNPEMMADSFTGCGRGAYDGQTYTPYPEGTYESALAYIRQRVGQEQ